MKIRKTWTWMKMNLNSNSSYSNKCSSSNKKINRGSNRIINRNNNRTLRSQKSVRVKRAVLSITSMLRLVSMEAI